MTKSIIITYNEADESFVMELLKRLKIKTRPVESSTSKDNKKILKNKKEKPKPKEN